jgi:hypothetical protein
MELKAQYTCDAPLGRVWERLLDPATIASCLPGCQRFEPIGDDRYRVVLTAGVAAITGTFEGTVQIADTQRERSYRLIVEGRGRLGFANGDATIQLSARTDGVVVDVNGTLMVGGLIAQVGQRFLATAGRTMLDRFFKCFQDKLAD